jgi:serine/threonine protein kinase
MASKYNLGKFLGEGTWGSVYEATRRSDGLQVAVKRIKPMDPSLGMNFTALREVKYLRELKNVNVVDVRIIWVLSTFLISVVIVKRRFSESGSVVFSHGICSV